MSRVVVLGAGISGHMAAAFLRKWLRRDDEVTVVSPKPTYNWIPSNIWVGVGLMSPADVVFPLAPVYERHGIEFKQARAVGLHPGGRADDPAPYLVAESTRPSQEGVREDIPYDFLIAGAFVAASMLLGIYVNPLFHWFTLFVGLKLLQSAFTQWCPMMAVLRKAGVRA